MWPWLFLSDVSVMLINLKSCVFACVCDIKHVCVWVICWCVYTCVYTRVEDLLFSVPCFEMKSLCSPGCLGPCYVNQAGFTLRNLPASASWILGLKVCIAWGWRDGSAVQGTVCSCKGTRLDSQLTGICNSSSLCRHQIHTWYTDRQRDLRTKHSCT